MKALEILEECLENEKYIMKGYESLSNIEYIQEAIAELEALENYDRLGLNTSEKLRIQLEERLDCSINEFQMDLILEYIYDFLSYKQDELEALQEENEHLKRMA